MAINLDLIHDSVEEFKRRMDSLNARMDAMKKPHVNNYDAGEDQNKKNSQFSKLLMQEDKGEITRAKLFEEAKKLGFSVQEIRFQLDG